MAPPSAPSCAHTVRSLLLTRAVSGGAAPCHSGGSGLIKAVNSPGEALPIRLSLKVVPDAFWAWVFTADSRRRQASGDGILPPAAAPLLPT